MLFVSTDAALMTLYTVLAAADGCGGLSTWNVPVRTPRHTAFSGANQLSVSHSVSQSVGLCCCCQRQQMMVCRRRHSA